LSMSLGVPLQFDHPAMQSAIDRVARAAAKAGIWWGTVTSSPALAQQALDSGARMVTCANDHFLLLDGLREAYRQFSELRVR
jgi:4-hydroxy-2-oxoheptanedioate aldolase